MGGIARISHQQLICIVALFQHVTMLLFLTSNMAKEAGHGAWLIPFLAVLLGGLPTALLTGLLVRHHPGRSCSEIAERCLGRYGGKLVALILASQALFVAGLNVRDVMDFVPVAVLPDTPAWAVGLTFGAVVAYAAYSGGEVIARLSVLIFLVVSVALLTIPMTLLDQLSITRAVPVIESGGLGLLRAAWQVMGWYAEVWLFVEFAALLDKPQLAARALVVGQLIAAFFLATMTAMTVMLFGPDLTAHFNFPSYSLIQQISVGEFLDRMEVFLIILWVTGMVTKTGGYLWIASVVTGRLFGMKNDRRLLPVLVVFMLGIPYLFPNFQALVAFSAQYSPLQMIPAFLVPGTLLVVSLVQRRSRGPVKLGSD